MRLGEHSSILQKEPKWERQLISKEIVDFGVHVLHRRMKVAKKPENYTMAPWFALLMSAQGNIGAEVRCE